MPRHHSDQDQHRQNGHSRLRASWLATGHTWVTAATRHHGWPSKNGIVDPRDPAQNPTGPTGLLSPTRPTGRYYGGWVAKQGD